MPAVANTPSSVSASSSEERLLPTSTPTQISVHAGGSRSLDHQCRFLLHEEQVAVGIHRASVDRQFKVLPPHPGGTIPALNIG